MTDVVGVILIALGVWVGMGLVLLGAVWAFRNRLRSVVLQKMMGGGLLR